MFLTLNCRMDVPIKCIPSGLKSLLEWSTTRCCVLDFQLQHTMYQWAAHRSAPNLGENLPASISVLTCVTMNSYSLSVFTSWFILCLWVPLMCHISIQPEPLLQPTQYSTNGWFGCSSKRFIKYICIDPTHNSLGWSWIVFILTSSLNTATDEHRSSFIINEQGCWANLQGFA